MISKGFDHLNFSVADLDRSVEFYQTIFDFKLVEEGDSESGRFAILQLNESMLCLYHCPKRKFLDRFALKKENLHGLNHFAFNIIDEEKFLERLKKNSIEILYDGQVIYPFSKSYYILDPTGYELECAVWAKGKIQFKK